MKIRQLHWYDWIGVGLIVLGLVLSSWYVMHGDIIFHSDIARDMVLMQEAVTNHRPSLLGPRTGAIPGMFHGPAWLLANLPAFIVGHGNPVIVGWGWIVMEIFFLISSLLVTAKMFNRTIAIWTTVLLASRIPLFSHQLFNPSGFSLMMPLFIYFLWRYINLSIWKDFVWLMLITGLLIHFEAVFGVPMFIACMILLFWKIVRHKVSYFQVLLPIAILIPLSTYLIFDLKHNWVQTQAIWKYLTDGHEVFMTLKEVITNRWQTLTISLGILSVGTQLIHKLLAIVFWLLFIFGLLKDNKSHIYSIYLLIGIVFWTFSLLIFEPIKGYYYDFSYLNAVIFVSQLLRIHKYLLLMVLVPVLFVNFRQSKVVAFSTKDFSGNMESSWKFNDELAKEIVADAPSEFSIFTLDTDIFGYSANYAIRYESARENKKINTTSKSSVTYLVIAKNTINHPQFDVRWWKEGQIKILAKPSKSWEYKEKFLIERYDLTPDQVAIPEDPDLMSTKTSLR